MADNGEEEGNPNTLIVQSIKWIAYSLVAYLIVGLGIMGNLLSLVVLTRPNLKGVMYVYLLGLAVSNLCVLLTAVPALYDISSGLGGGHYTTAFFQAHLKLPLINSFMASSVYIIICMTVNRCPIIIIHALKVLIWSPGREGPWILGGFCKVGVNLHFGRKSLIKVSQTHTQTHIHTH